MRDITTDGAERAIVTAIVQMAHSVGFVVIAEGVETPAQQAFLSQQGCDEVQGYLFSKPLPADQIEDFVRMATAASGLGASAPPAGRVVRGFTSFTRYRGTAAIQNSGKYTQSVFLNYRQ